MYADVIIDISLEQLDRAFQYAIPRELEEKVSVGVTVDIPFGVNNRHITGYVVGISDVAKYPVDKIKRIEGITEGKVSAQSRLIKLAAWLKHTYGSTMNQAIKTVIPVKDTVRQKEKKSVNLIADDNMVAEYLELYRRKNATARYRLLSALKEEPVIDSEIVRTKLNISVQIVKALEQQGLISVQSEQQYRNPVKADSSQEKKIVLNEGQKRAVDMIVGDYDRGDRETYLLHGVTGSGKTEVYLDVIEHVTALGKQAIVLIPEIALTFQTVQRFYRRFGDKVSIINSRMSKGERYDQFLRAMRGDISIMIGPRSALFTPFSDIGLIVIDEEHEGTYRSETAPRYHARETAIHIAKECNASVVLGSATPSVESFYNAEKGVYKLIKLESRAGDARMADVDIVDLRDELMKGNRTIFSDKLRKLMKDRLAKGEQTMLFLNKRGVAGFISCRSCGMVMKCPHCDVSLTEHADGRLMCHYCGYTSPKITVCPKCGSRYVIGFRAGTEAVEKQVKKEFPQARVLRMDMDTTRGKDGHEKILAEFANGGADILVGTQMIVKGHDFPNVTLVGVLAADMSLYASDYRASERTFQLLTQAAGRAGRSAKRGEAVIQTYSPQHFSIVCAAGQDYNEFYRQEIAYRKMLGYPPVSNLMKVILSSQDERAVNEAAALVKRYIDDNFLSDGFECVGPAKAPIYKIKDVYSMIICARHADREQLSKLYEQVDKLISGNVVFKNVSAQYDING